MTRGAGYLGLVTSEMKFICLLGSLSRYSYGSFSLY